MGMPQGQAGEEGEEQGAHFSFAALYDGHGGRGAAEMSSKLMLESCLLPALTALAEADDEFPQVLAAQVAELSFVFFVVF